MKSMHPVSAVNYYISTVIVETTGLEAGNEQGYTVKEFLVG